MKNLIFILFTFIFFQSCLTTSKSKEQYAQLSEQDKNLISAIVEKDEVKVLHYLKEGANPNVKSNILVSKLIELIGQEDTIKFLSIDSKDELKTIKHSALNIAIYLNLPKIVKDLIAYKANVNEIIGNSTLLFLTVSLKKYDILKILLQNGADLRKGFVLKNIAGYTKKMDILEHTEDVCFDRPDIVNIIKKYYKKQAK